MPKNHNNLMKSLLNRYINSDSSDEKHDADSSEAAEKKQDAEEDDYRSPSNTEEPTIPSENSKQDEMNESQIEKEDGDQALNNNNTKTSQEVEQLLEQIESLKDELKKKTTDLEKTEQKLEVLEKVQQQELKSLRDEKKELEEEIEMMSEHRSLKSSEMDEHEKSLRDERQLVKHLESENRKLKSKFTESNQAIEKKMDETVAEFRKTFEDQIRMLSRRIHVAEQLHLENREVYRKTKEKFENEDEELKDRVVKTEVAFKKMKDISLWANKTLSGMDVAALKFEESSGNLLNRISKSSCEVLFARDWVRRKKSGAKHLREEMECLLEEMHGKEKEILKYRERVWKSEHRTRELEKMVKEREEGMVALGEEKREAIRQLCVWIDYHRTSKHYLEKIIVSSNSIHE